MFLFFFFFFNDTATTEIYTLSLHDALPILGVGGRGERDVDRRPAVAHRGVYRQREVVALDQQMVVRSEEHTSELQSRQYLVCRLLLEKKKKRLHRTLIRQKFTYTH